MRLPCALNLCVDRAAGRTRSLWTMAGKCSVSGSDSARRVSLARRPARKYSRHLLREPSRMRLDSSCRGQGCFESHKTSRARTFVRPAPPTRSEGQEPRWATPLASPSPLVTIAESERVCGWRRASQFRRPTRSRRHPAWADVPDAHWDDWRWQSQNAIRSVRQLADLLPFTAEEREAIGRA